MEISCSNIYRYYFLVLFLQRKYRDFTEVFCLWHKISVNVTQNFQEKYEHFTHILCDLSAENVLTRFTVFLQSFKISVNARIYRVRNLQRKSRHFTDI